MNFQELFPEYNFKNQKKTLKMYYYIVLKPLLTTVL